MATSKIPNNPNIPTTPPTPGNVASLVSKDTLSNLKNSDSPKTFGDQAKKLAAAKAIQAATQSTLAKLYKEKAALVQEGIKLDIDHQKTSAEIEIKHIPTKQVQNGQVIDVPAELNDSEYQVAIDVENTNYKEAQDNLQERKDKNQKAIDDFLKDPFKKQKDKAKESKNIIKKRKTKLTEDERKAKKAQNKSILQNAKKTLLPIVTLLLSNKLAEIIAQNDKIGKLVDDTNAIITEANESGDATKLQNAKLARDNAIKIIQSNEDKIIKLRDDINRITTYITIFNIIVNIIGSIILSLPVPSPAPDVTTVPKETFRRKVYEPALKLLNGLSALLPILLVILQKAIDILEDYKTQLLDINGQLEKAAVSGADNLLNNGAGTRGAGGVGTRGAGGVGTGGMGTGGVGGTGGIEFGTMNETYKGFKFAIREDNSFGGISVGGFKRHYAVAIDINGVDVLKSELSFTLDTNDLIEQLKLVIDQQKLIA